MELHQLRYFEAAASAGSMSRAAERCRVAQPSLSQQIARLEESLGVRLFDRLGRGVALTPAGRALLPRARRILNEARDARENLRADIDEGTGRLSVGAIPTMAPYLLPPALAGVRAAYPGCELHVREDLTERLLEQVSDLEVDVAVMSTPIEHAGVDVRVVGEERLVVVAAREGMLEGSGEITLEALREMPRVSLDEMHCLGRQIAGFCSARRVGANVVCCATQLSTLLEMVRLGLGVSLAPEMAAREDRSGTRVYAALKRGGPTREIAVVTRKGRTLGKAGERFVELVARSVTEGVRASGSGGRSRVRGGR